MRPGMKLFRQLAIASLFTCLPLSAGCGILADTFVNTMFEGLSSAVNDDHRPGDSRAERQRNAEESNVRRTAEQVQQIEWDQRAAGAR